MKRAIVFLGKSGSGKDTQAELLAKKHKLEVIRIGDLIREKAESDKELAAQLESGKLADNSKVDQLMASAIRQLKNDSIFISDGYPRHIEQAHKLEKILTDNSAQLAVVICFELSDSNAELRLKLRGRDDDTPDAISKRLKEFGQFTRPVVEYFESQSLLIRIDASPLPKTIFAALESALQGKGLI